MIDHGPLLFQDPRTDDKKTVADPMTLSINHYKFKSHEDFSTGSIKVSFVSFPSPNRFWNPFVFLGSYATE